MDRVRLLEALKAYTVEATKYLLLPVRVQSDSELPAMRPPAVYCMRLPDSKSAMKKTPYILHQAVTSRDQQDRGEPLESSAVIRTIFAVYSDDEQEGGLHLLNVMERFRIPLLRDPWIANGQFELDLQDGVESMIYPDDTAPYFVGEMMTTWRMPPVKREVPQIW